MGKIHSFIYLIQFLLLLNINSFTYAQSNKKCTSFVYNMTTGDMKIRDICYNVKILSYHNMNEFSTSNKKDKRDEFWKFVNRYFFPLPPLLEQNRIVQKLDQLMQYCNELEASIKESESQNKKILQQVLREALSAPVGKREKAAI